MQLPQPVEARVHSALKPDFFRIYRFEMDTATGKVVAQVPIGTGVDGTAFDPTTGYAFSSCGDGTVTVAHEDSPDRLTVVQRLVG